jgi:transposase
MDLDAFYGAYRTDGQGAAAYEPSMMVTLLLYAYATEQRSSRMIERHCRQDVAYRVITGNVVPDHATIARFVVRHERALAEVFGQVLKLCDRAGLVSAGVIAIDGTRLAGNASKDRNREFGRIAREILAQAKATDEAEDQQHGEARGDELPEPLRTAEGRRAFFRQARQRLTTKASEGESGEREEVANDAETSGTATDTTAQGRQLTAGQRAAGRRAARQRAAREQAARRFGTRRGDAGQRAAGGRGARARRGAGSRAGVCV